MASVTSVQPTAKDPARASIRVDGRAFATVPMRVVHDLALRKGTPWTDELADRVRREARCDKAYRSALNRLNRRAMTAARLREKLLAAGHDADAADAALDRLRTLGLIDDDRLARQLIEEQCARRPAGPRLLQARLRRAGIDENTARQSVDEAFEHTRDATADARRLAQQRLRSLMRYDAPTRKRRLWGLLARRGFDYDTIESVLADLPELKSDPAADE